jgi:translation initiation factor IF-2
MKNAESGVAWTPLLDVAYLKEGDIIRHARNSEKMYRVVTMCGGTPLVVAVQKVTRHEGWEVIGHVPDTSNNALCVKEAQ